MNETNMVEILIVEDTPQDLELALRALRKANLTNRIQVARDGAEALEFIFCEGAFAHRTIGNGPKVILLDLKLPKVDGLEVLARIKGDPRTKAIPVVVLTSSKEQSDVVESYKLGVNSYIVKPVNFEQFAKAVQELGMYWLLLNQPPLPGNDMPQRIQILILEDNPSDAELVLRELRRAGFEPEWKRMDTEADYVANLRPELDLILSDYDMPQFSGLRALELLKQSGLEVPLIIVSGTIGEDTAVAAMKQGATDYLLKDRLTRLGVSVGHALEQSRLRTERQQAEASLKLFRALVDNSNDAFEVIDPVTARFLDVNGRGCSDLGYTREEFLQLRVFDIDPTVTEAMWRPLMDKTRQMGSNSLEAIHVRKDGTKFPVEISVKMVRLDREYAVAVVRDITARKRAEEIVEQASNQVINRRRKGVVLELVGLGVLAVLVFELATRFDWFEVVNDWILHHSIEPLDELVFTLGFVVLGLMVFAFRRWREAKTEMTSRQQVQTALHLMNDELDLRVKRRTAELLRANEELSAEIAERQQAQREVARQKARFEFIFGSVPVGIAWMQQGKPTSRIVNAAHAKLSGVPMELCQRLEEYRKATPAEDRVRQDELHRRLVAGEIDHYEMEKRYLHGDGTAYWVLLSVRVFHDPATGEFQEISTIVDLTEHKLAQTALRESEERFRQLAENIQEVFWMTKPDMEQVLYVSPAYEMIWGRSCESLYASPRQWLEAIHPEDRQRVMAAAEAKIPLGEYSEVYRIVRPDGVLRWIEDRAFPIRDKEGKIYRIVGTAKDVTETRKLEEQYRQAQKMEAIGTLAGGIAHDFNNILAAMNGYTELAKMNLGVNDQVEDYLDSVLQAGKRATGLVRQILTFSRQQEQQRRPLQLREVVEESVKFLRATIPTTIEIKTAYGPELSLVQADPTQIHQVVMNLGTNAWHAMRDRAGCLTVQLEDFTVDAQVAQAQPRLKEGRYVRLSISDTGCGMTKAILERIFEPFFTTKPQGEGTGLGLAVVHGIMQSHDGEVTVYSEVGQGTVFRLYFPVHAGVAAAAGASAGPIPRGQGKRILYVDDEEPLARLGQKTLEQLGYKVEMRTDAAKAVELVRGEPGRFDLIITDQTMPGMTGLELAAQVHAVRADLPIILTSGYSGNLTSEKLRELGIRELLLKPQTIQSLAMAVQRAVKT